MARREVTEDNGEWGGAFGGGGAGAAAGHIGGTVRENIFPTNPTFDPAAESKRESRTTTNLTGAGDGGESTENAIDSRMRQHFILISPAIHTSYLSPRSPIYRWRKISHVEKFQISMHDRCGEI